MKVLPFQIPKPTQGALIYQEDHEVLFYDQLHQHEEIQLSFIAEGEGTLVVGDTVSHYQRGDFLVIGSNLPHVFKSEPNSTQKSLMITLFFTKEGFGSEFFELDELSDLTSFFNKAINGFRVLSHKKQLEQAFLSLSNSNKAERFILFLQILQWLSKAKKETLSSFVYEKNYSANEGKRIQDVISYTINNYQTAISLDDIAYVASMTKNAFCKYFKKRTNKTYVQFLNELRIENASKLLLNKIELSIAEVAYQCGFGNLSNFNRKFKEIKGKTPSEYRLMN